MNLFTDITLKYASNIPGNVFLGIFKNKKGYKNIFSIKSIIMS